MKRIAIVGGGFCGTLIAIHLLTKSEKPLSLTLIDRAGAFAQGVAYSTREPHHYLNVRAEEMSAFPDQPAHFIQWLRNFEPLWRSLDPVFSSLKVTPQSFLPRKIYGLYLKECLKKALEETTCQFQSLTAEAVDIERKRGHLELTLSNGTSLVADALVLATGVPAAKGKKSLTGFTANIWEPTPESLLAQASLGHLPESTQVVIIGSGLTTADALMSLFMRNYRGHVTVLSRHGRFSEPHGEPMHAFPEQFSSVSTAKGLFRMMRQQIDEAETDWRPIVDALRPFTATLWSQLAPNEKKRFLRHLLSLWNRHRHRMPPQCHEKILEALEIGKLKVLSGRFRSVEPASEGLHVTYLSEGKFVNLNADYVLNCTGPDYASAKQPLINKAVEKGVVHVDELGLGLCWSTQGPVYPVGALLFGERLETTAVPELRQQAQKIAEILIDKYSKNS